MTKAASRALALPVALEIQGAKLRMGMFGPDLLVVVRADFEQVLAALTKSTWTIREPGASRER